ncbi:hypothetical protein [Sorangium sp. So ce1153]|uniref:hypothetical protein n=1 Tax=Sorangium sp. So ce1153 TaxID=3133333 RepID=UPI003F5F2248
MNIAANDDRRAVYVMTNATPNAIQTFHRAGDGALSPGASYPTGGNGHAPNPPLGFPILDCAVSMGDDFLYVLSPDGFSVPPFTGAGPAMFHGYRIEPSGALTSLGPPVGCLPQGATGLVAV